MQALTVVVSLDKPADALQDVLQVLVLIGVYLFPLQRFNEALASGIVVRISRSAHAGDYLVVTEYTNVLGGRILHTPIRMVHQSRRRLPVCDSPSESVQRKFCA